jgi:hypothetical protein
MAVEENARSGDFYRASLAVRILFRDQWKALSLSIGDALFLVGEKSGVKAGRYFPTQK